VTGLVCIATAPALAVDPAGDWLTGDRKGIVRVVNCGSALCGTVVWLQEPLDPYTSGPRTDKNNVDVSQRSRPLIGLPIMLHLAPSPASPTFRVILIVGFVRPHLPQAQCEDVTELPLNVFPLAQDAPDGRIGCVFIVVAARRQRTAIPRICHGRARRVATGSALLEGMLSYHHRPIPQREPLIRIICDCRIKRSVSNHNTC
jgi:Uncharacterized protein conserved in bacteria (DUF2147)